MTLINPYAKTSDFYQLLSQIASMPVSFTVDDKPVALIGIEIVMDGKDKQKAIVRLTR